MACVYQVEKRNAEDYRKYNIVFSEEEERQYFEEYFRNPENFDDILGKLPLAVSKFLDLPEEEQNNTDNETNRELYRLLVFLNASITFRTRANVERIVVYTHDNETFFTQIEILSVARMETKKNGTGENRHALAEKESSS